MRISDIYRRNSEELKRSIIMDIELWENAHKNLESAIKTLKKNVEKIFNFTKEEYRVKFKNGKKIKRVNAEYEMRKIKKLYRQKYGFRTIKMTIILMKNILKCEIEVG
ncbi:MAG: hypothetical protein ACTSPY_09370 [Candidatus Helarchaeota archaeon]